VTADETRGGLPSDEDATSGPESQGKPAARGGPRAAGRPAKAAGAGKPSGGAKKPAAKRPAGGATKPAAKRPADGAKKPAAKKHAAKDSGGGGPAAEQTAVTAPQSVPLSAAVETAADDARPTAAAAEPPAGVAEAPPGPRSSLSLALAPVGRALTSRRAPKLRAAVSAFLVAAAVLAVLVSTLALWSRSIVFDADAYVRVVAPTVEDPQVRRAVADYVAGAAVRATALETRIEAALPSDAKVLAPVLTRSLQRFLGDEVDDFLGTELARRLWGDINRLAHGQLIAALRDENRYVTVGRNDVELNLLPLVAVALQRLDDEIPRLLGRDVTLPQIDPTTAPDDIRTLLQDALGRELPTDFGTITLLRGTQGYEAKQALRLFNDLVILVVVLTVVLIAAAVLVAVRRLRTVLWLGIGALLAFIAARVVAVQLEEAVTGAIESQGGAAVARSVLSSTVDSLNGFFVWVAVAGAVVAVAAFLATRPAWLAAIGGGVAELFGVASDLTTPDTRSGRWLAGHLDLLRLGGVAVAIVALLFATASPTAVLVIVLALIVYELALTTYALGVPREPEDGPPDAP
jgi:hypothetical protein